MIVVALLKFHPAIVDNCPSLDDCIFRGSLEILDDFRPLILHHALNVLKDFFTARSTFIASFKELSILLFGFS